MISMYQQQPAKQPSFDYAAASFDHHSKCSHPDPFGNASFFKTHSRQASSSSNLHQYSFPQHQHSDLDMSASTSSSSGKYARHSSTSSVTSVTSSNGSGIATPNSSYSLTPSSAIMNAFTNPQNTISNTNVARQQDNSTESLVPTSPSVVRPKKKLRQRSNYFSNIANMVCLFWFNETKSLESAFERVTASGAATGKVDPAVLDSLAFSKLSMPTNAFKQFIMNIIKHTQLPPTAVSLALYYILRLKQVSARPIVGNANSEYRVFSVALMLANKFLDDNTYTNKTWSEVTHLPLKEISAMEVEFLANMRYSLYVNSDDWGLWQRRLRIWLNIHSSVCLGFQTPTMPVQQLQVPTTVFSQPSSPTMHTNTNTNANNKRFMSEHLHTEGPAAKKVAVALVEPPQPVTAMSLSPETNCHIIAATRLTSSPYAPVFPVRTLLANAQVYGSTGYNSNASSRTCSPVVGGAAPFFAAAPQQQASQVSSHMPVYYYTLADLKYKMNPSPKCGFLPAASSQTQSPVYAPNQQQLLDLERYRPGSMMSMVLDQAFPVIQQQQPLQPLHSTTQLHQQHSVPVQATTTQQNTLSSSSLHQSAWTLDSTATSPYGNGSHNVQQYF